MEPPSTLVFRKFFGVHWEEAVGQRLFDATGEVGVVSRVQFTNFRGPFEAIVHFEDGAPTRTIPLGPDSPQLATLPCGARAAARPPAAMGGAFKAGAARMPPWRNCDAG